MHSSFEWTDAEEKIIITGKEQGQGRDSHHDYIDTCQITLTVQEDTDQKSPCTHILQLVVYPNKQFNFFVHLQQNTANEAE